MAFRLDEQKSNFQNWTVQRCQRHHSWNYRVVIDQSLFPKTVFPLLAKLRKRTLFILIRLVLQQIESISTASHPDNRVGVVLLWAGIECSGV